MEISVEETVCSVSLYYCKVEHKQRAILFRWLGIKGNALFKHGIGHEFYFRRRHRWQKDTFVRKLGLSVAQNNTECQFGQTSPDKSQK